MKTILVTGGAGFIGSHTIVELIKNQNRIIVVDNFSNSNTSSLAAIKELTQQDVKLYEADLKDKPALTQIFAQEQIDCVIHFAAYKAVGESVDQPLKYYENNINGTINLLSVMADFNVKNFVFSSSATVYSVEGKVPLIEDSPLAAASPYGQSKLMVENILRDLANSDASWKIISLRYFNPFGAHESGKLGELPNGIPNNLVPYINQVAVGKLEKLSVFGDDYATPDGSCIRDYIHIMDLATGHVAALNKIYREHQGFAAYNLGSGKGYSVFEIINNFERVTGNKIPFVVTGRRAGDIAAYYACIDKAIAELEWNVTKDIDDMCRDAWNWEVNNAKIDS